MYFEGSEKKAEIVIDSNKLSLLSDFDDTFWQQLVSCCNAQILSSISNDQCKAFLLSESSLFVWHDRLLILTCGVTHLVNSVEYLLKNIPQQHIKQVIYQRKNEYFSHEQPSCFGDDIQLLAKYIDGEAYRFGEMDAHHNFVFHQKNQFIAAKEDKTYELLAYQISEQASKTLTTPGVKIDMREVIDEMVDSGIEFPAVIRFHDILRSQVELLNKTFRDTIEEAQYQGKYLGVFPVKVNQMREVIEEIVDAGSRFNYGLEAGSKPELIAALAYNTNQDSLTILNGYKDEEYLRLALLGLKINRKIVIVIEKFSELKKLIALAKQLDVQPIIGLRVKMMVKGRGKWESSSGERAKFGLSIAEILNAVKLLEQEHLTDAIKLLHFH